MALCLPSTPSLDFKEPSLLHIQAVQWGPVPCFKDLPSTFSESQKAFLSLLVYTVFPPGLCSFSVSENSHYFYLRCLLCTRMVLSVMFKTVTKALASSGSAATPVYILVPCVLWAAWVCPLTVDSKTPLHNSLWWNGIKLRTQSHHNGVEVKGFECCECYVVFSGKDKMWMRELKCT